MTDRLDDRLARLAALGEPARRALYRYVVGEAEPVTREQAAGEIGIAHHVAKFHLDRLVDDGLLDAGYQRPPGRGGPGAGRPAKVYHRTADDLAVSLPERRYDLAGQILVSAVAAAEHDGVGVGDAIHTVASRTGHAIGMDARADHPAPPGSTRRRRAEHVAEVLAEYGYAPRIESDAIVLSNCPFHVLAEQETALVCGMNRDLVAGVLEGMEVKSCEARLDPSPGRCCVRIDERETRRQSSSRERSG